MTKLATDNTGLKASKFIAAGSPTTCFLPSCRAPFNGICTHGNDGHYYCSPDCADEGRKIDLSHIEELRPRTSALPPVSKKFFQS